MVYNTCNISYIINYCIIYCICNDMGCNWCIWIGLWIVLTFIGWNIAAVINGELVCTAWSLGSAVKNMIGLTMEYTLKYHIIKFCENLIGMCLIFLFLWTSFDCGVCVSGDTREAYRGD
eukprot:406001_1